MLTPAGAGAGGRAEARVPDEVRARPCPDNRPRALLTQSRPSGPGGGDNSPGSRAETSGKGALAAPAPPNSLRRCARPPHSLSGPRDASRALVWLTLPGAEGGGGREL